MFSLPQPLFIRKTPSLSRRGLPFPKKQNPFSELAFLSTTGAGIIFFCIFLSGSIFLNQLIYKILFASTFFKKYLIFFKKPSSRGPSLPKKIFYAIVRKINAYA